MTDLLERARVRPVEAPARRPVEVPLLGRPARCSAHWLLAGLLLEAGAIHLAMVPRT